MSRMGLGVSRAFYLLFSLLLVSCGTPFWQSNSNRFEEPSHYFSSMKSLLVEVAFEPDAEPYTGTGIGGRPVWDFVEENVAALFKDRPHPVTILVPKEIEQMRVLPNLGKTGFTSEDIIDIGDRARRNRSNDQQSAFFVVFLNGYYEEKGVIKNSVLGVSLSGTSIIAIFKPVVMANLRLDSNDASFVAKYVEQSTIVHEIGHALGLVNNGLPMVHSHVDEVHGAHCTNRQCVMHWSHEGAVDLRDFVNRFIRTQTLVVFDDECLLDAHRYRPK